MSKEPETPLPWQKLPMAEDWIGDDVHVYYRPLEQDEAFIIHACNAYPKLVEFIEAMREQFEGHKLAEEAANLLEELGEL